MSMKYLHCEHMLCHVLCVYYDYCDFKTIKMCNSCMNVNISIWLYVNLLINTFTKMKNVKIDLKQAE